MPAYIKAGKGVRSNEEALKVLLGFLIEDPVRVRNSPDQMPFFHCVDDHNRKSFFSKPVVISYNGEIIIEKIDETVFATFRPDEIAKGLRYRLVK